MWAAFIRLHQLLQKLMPLRVVYDPQKQKFVGNNKRCWSYWNLNSQVYQVWPVAGFRMIHYLRSDETEAGITFVDFVIDMLVWALTLLEIGCVYSHKYNWDYLAWALNQHMASKDLTGTHTINYCHDHKVRHIYLSHFSYNSTICRY